MYFILICEVAPTNHVPLSLGDLVLPVFTTREKAEGFLGHPETDAAMRKFADMHGSFDVMTVNTNLAEIQRRVTRAGSKISSYIVDPVRADQNYLLAEAVPLFAEKE